MKYLILIFLLFTSCIESRQLYLDRMDYLEVLYKEATSNSPVLRNRACAEVDSLKKVILKEYKNTNSLGGRSRCANLLDEIHSIQFHCETTKAIEDLRRMKKF